MAVAIIDSGGANIASVQFALQRLGAETFFTDDRRVIESADHVILPGVGAAGSAMTHLRNKDLVECIRQLEQPVLGICLGMQLLFEASDEGNTECLGIIPGRLGKLKGDEQIRIPHMGWNSTAQQRPDALLKDLDQSPWFYFVHTFCAPVSEATVAVTEHGSTFSAMVQHANFRGAQFHPERSAHDGARILKNFLEL